MTINVVWLSRHATVDARGPWDTGLLELLFSHRLWPTGYKFVHHVVDQIPVEISEAIVIVPARHHVEDWDWLNEQIRPLRAVLLMLVGDEESLFPWQAIRHSRSRLWISMPHPEHHRDAPENAFFIGNGFKEDTPDLVASVDKSLSWVFAGQVTHSRRRACVQALRHLNTPGELITTAGFTQGLERDEYMRLLGKARTVPCPSGPHSPDTFRVYETLESGGVPVVDDMSRLGWSGYWQMLYGDNPLPTLTDWYDIAEYIDRIDLDWPVPAISVGAWWRQQKQRLATRLVADLAALGFAPPTHASDVTVIVTSSPSPKHPSSHMLDTVLESVPADWPVIVGFDGVRDEQHHLANSYLEYVYTMVRRFQQFPNRVPVWAGRHVHQANLTRMMMEHVTTPAVLFVEHDTPLTGNIDWQSCLSLVVDGHLDVLRFHHESEILEPHKYLMVDHIDQTMNGVPIRRTRQWSQRPHLANADYYRKILHRWFPLASRTMIEDRMHSVCQVEPYVKNRVAIYHPEGNIRRSLHLDGREDELKFEMEFGL